MHADTHPLARQTVKVKMEGTLQDFVIEDWWDRLTGASWMVSDGNPAALLYAMRCGLTGLPFDDEVVYGKINGSGHLVNVIEFIDADDVEDVAEELEMERARRAELGGDDDFNQVANFDDES